MALVSGTDTYADVAYVDAYAASRVHAQGNWSSLTLIEKESVLTMALYQLDAMFSWKGRVVSETQGVNWPRQRVYTDQGILVSDLTIPDRIKKAQAELALLWSSNDQLTPPASAFTKDDTSTAQVRSEKLGDLAREYFKNDMYRWEVYQGFMREKVYPVVEAIVKPYITSSPSDGFAEVMLF